MKKSKEEFLTIAKSMIGNISEKDLKIISSSKKDWGPLDYEELHSLGEIYVDNRLYYFEVWNNMIGICTSEIYSYDESGEPYDFDNENLINIDNISLINDKNYLANLMWLDYDNNYNDENQIEDEISKNDGKKFIIEIDHLSNAAFEDLNSELSRLLYKAAQCVESGRTDGPLIDYNGNKVGKFELIKKQGGEK